MYLVDKNILLKGGAFFIVRWLKIFQFKRFKGAFAQTHFSYSTPGCKWLVTLSNSMSTWFVQFLLLTGLSVNIVILEHLIERKMVKYCVISLSLSLYYVVSSRHKWRFIRFWLVGLFFSNKLPRRGLILPNISKHPTCLACLKAYNTANTSNWS